MTMQTKKTIFDAFNQITNEKQSEKPDLSISIWKYLTSQCLSSDKVEVDEDGIPKELKYTLRRLIQGLGSSRAPVRNGYFSTLVVLLSKPPFSSEMVTLDCFMNLVEVALTKYESKGEEGEVLTGRILAYGVAMRSDLFRKGSSDLQKKIISDMISKSKDRSYLPPLCYSFIADLMNYVDDSIFKNIVWPIIQDEIVIPWSSQTFDTIDCLLKITKRFPSVVKKELISRTMCTPTILHETSIENLQKMLVNITWELSIKHPVYETVASILTSEEKCYLLTPFWNFIDQSLIGSPTRLKLISVFTIFCSIIRHSNLDQIPELLTPNFVSCLVNSCESTVKNSDRLCLLARESLKSVVDRVSDKSDPNAAAAYHVLRKLIFEYEYILIDKITGVKTVFPCVTKLDGQHVKLLLKKCENVVFMKSKPQDASKKQWKFKDRSYACHLLARLISHPEIKDMDWKIKHLKVMLKHALFTWKSYTKENMSDELAAILKNAFFAAISQQFSQLENHRIVLISQVYFIDNLLTDDEYKLRTSVSNKMRCCWKDTLSKIQKIDLKLSKTNNKKIMHVFHTLYLQMTLHLFVDATVAENVIYEIDRSYMKRKKKKIENDLSLSINEESDWIEMTVEMFLNLLSNDNHLLRQLISKIFPPLCEHLTAQAAYHILQVLDPLSKNVFVGEDNESNDESEDEPSGSVQQNNSAIRNIEDESDSEIDDVDDIEETAIDKTRQAVRDALGMAGSVTDTESVDLDDIDEEEGQKLDVALSLAFMNAQKTSNSKNVKQSPHDKAMTNFRIRVLDLVDIYLANNPSLSLVLETIPVLFKLLEFTIRDNHQHPLQNRVRSTINKIGHLKKVTFSEEVDAELLVEVLKGLIEKGVRSTPVFLDLCNEMSACCTFLIRIHVQNHNDISYKSPLFGCFTTALDNFFLKRDCLLPVLLFENILGKTNWIKNLELCAKIVELSFDVNVRGFRKNQGLSMLNSFFRNARILTLLEEQGHMDQCEKILNSILKKSSKIIRPKNGKSHNLSNHFLGELFSLLCTIRNNKHFNNGTKWNKFAETFKQYLNDQSDKSNLLRKYAVKLGNILGVNVNRIKEKTECLIVDNNHIMNGYDAEKISDKCVSEEITASSTNTKKPKRKKTCCMIKESIPAKRLRYGKANEAL